MYQKIGEEKMLKSDFYYDLPEELIAQTPAEPRDSSRLMKIDKETGRLHMEGLLEIF